VKISLQALLRINEKLAGDWAARVDKAAEGEAPRLQSVVRPYRRLDRFTPSDILYLLREGGEGKLNSTSPTLKRIARFNEFDPLAEIVQPAA
jgi:hypothetical protein